MKRFTVIAALVAAFICSVLVSRVALADGKMMIYPYKWRSRPQSACQPLINIKVNNRDWNLGHVINKPEICPELPRNWIARPAPETSETDLVEIPPVPQIVQNHFIDNFDILSGTFKESSQRAIIAWNGYEDDRGEETLILTTNEKSRVGEDIPMLSVMPLPGEPIDIQVVDPNIFLKTRKLLYSKLPPSEAATYSYYEYQRVISPHNIFVLKLDNLDSFKKEVTAYVAAKYNYQAAALIDQNTEKIIKAYFDRGFRYFAFDLTEVRENSSDKAAIIYRFKSKFVYFPLQISGVGGTDSRTYVDLIIMTPGMIQNTGVVKIGKDRNDAAVIGNQSVPFTMKEVAGLNPELAKVFKSQNNVCVRGVFFDGKLNGYDGDFTAKNFD